MKRELSTPEKCPTDPPKFKFKRSLIELGIKDLLIFFYIRISESIHHL